MNSARWKNKIHKYFGHGIFALCARGTLNLGPICGKTLSGGSERKKTCLGFLGRKKFRFSAGAVEWGGGEAARGLLPPGFYGAENGEWGLAKAGEGRDAAIQSQSRASWARTQELYSPPIHPNRYAMLICILRIRQFTQINMLICF